MLAQRARKRDRFFSLWAVLVGCAQWETTSTALQREGIGMCWRRIGDEARDLDRSIPSSHPPCGGGCEEGKDSEVLT